MKEIKSVSRSQETYINRLDALVDAKAMRASGWPSARVIELENGRFAIAIHLMGCGCGNCPCVRIDGSVA